MATAGMPEWEDNARSNYMYSLSYNDDKSLSDDGVPQASSAQTESDTATCPICFQDLDGDLREEGVTRARLDCEHKFCLSCIMKWSEKCRTCPYCRAAYCAIQILGTGSIISKLQLGEPMMKKDQIMLTHSIPTHMGGLNVADYAWGDSPWPMWQPPAATYIPPWAELREELANRRLATTKTTTMPMPSTWAVADVSYVVMEAKSAPWTALGVDRDFKVRQNHVMLSKGLKGKMPCISSPDFLALPFNIAHKTASPTI